MIEENPNQVADVVDFWTFARDTGSRDPNWHLVVRAALIDTVWASVIRLLFVLVAVLRWPPVATFPQYLISGDPTGVMDPPAGPSCRRRRLFPFSGGL